MDTITTMGIISDEVYNNDYYNGKFDKLKANNHIYKVLDHTDPNDQGFNALLLQDTSTGKYVIAFRGTQEKIDIADDVIIGLQNHSYEFEAAKVWVDTILKTKDKGYDVTKANLTLTGHSLGGILTQAVGAVYQYQIPGYAFNPYEVEILRPLQGDEIYHNLVINNDANLNKQDRMINRIYKKAA